MSSVALTLETLQKIARKKVNAANATSVLVSLNEYGEKYDLLVPHHLAPYLCQVMHESGEFQYDREVWGPTAAQKKYDTRVDLGNTPEADGDGKKNAGRGPMQVTGAANIRSFYDWCKKAGMNPPDFPANPDLINTDPWEGLSAIWYWVVGNPDRKSLNRYADSGNLEMITRRINGGLNGYADRLELYDRAALVLLGYEPEEIRSFQVSAKQKGFYDGEIDGESGPKTRSALHLALASLSNTTVASAPVTQKEAVAPPQIDKPVTKTTGFWERIFQIVGLSSVGGMSLANRFTSFFQDWRVVVAIIGGLIVVSLIGLFLHTRIINAVKAIKQEINS